MIKFIFSFLAPKHQVYTCKLLGVACLLLITQAQQTSMNKQNTRRGSVTASENWTAEVPVSKE